MIYSPINVICSLVKCNILANLLILVRIYECPPSLVKYDRFLTSYNSNPKTLSVLRCLFAFFFAFLTLCIKNFNFFLENPLIVVTILCENWHTSQRNYEQLVGDLVNWHYIRILCINLLSYDTKSGKFNSIEVNLEDLITYRF